MKLAMEDLASLVQRMWASFLGRCVHRFLRMAGIDRSLVLSSQAFTALIPLLLLVSAFASPGGRDTVANTIITKFGLSGASADSVEELFEVSVGAESSIGFVSAVLLLYSGVSFTRRLQKMYRAAFEREKTGVRGNMFALLGLFAFLVEVLLLYGIMSIVRSLNAAWWWVLSLSALAGLVPWTSIPYLLLDRQVHWRRLLVAGGLTATAMAIYGTATTFYMPELIEDYTSDFGLFGVTIAIIGWLLGAAGIIVASAAIGAEFDQSGESWVLRVKKRFRLMEPALSQPDAIATEPEA